MARWRVTWTEVRVGVFETEAKDGTGAMNAWYRGADRGRLLGDPQVGIHGVERVNVKRA
jgi:hypothetical protein